MKKSIFLFFAAILCATSAWAWCGNSFITVNGTWCTGSNSYEHTGGYFNGKDLGTLTTFELGGEFQVWPSSTTAGTLCYKIDDGTENSISLPKTGTEGNNSKHSGSGAVDLSGLAGGSHSIAVWFKHGSDIDNNGGRNFVATFTIAAATPDPEPEPEPVADVTVHFINSVEWAAVACHHWVDGGSGTSWPGDVLSKTDEIAGYDIYTATFTGEHTSCIFNNNNNGKQTGDLTVENGKYYEVNTNTWYADKAAAEAALAIPIPDETVYLINTGNWSKAMIHTWNGVGGTAWPGVEMTLTGETIEGYAVYSYTAKQGGQANLLFQESENVNKTGDLTWEAGKYYAPLKNEWYDTKEAAAEALAAPVEYEYVYLINTNDWAAAHIYTWTPEVAGWPGAAMTLEAEQIAGKDVYSYKVVKGTTFGGMLFNCGSDECKTGDLTWQTGKYYAHSTGEWYADAATAETALATPVPTYDYYITGSLVGGWDPKQQGLEKDGELYKATFTELNAGEYEFKITAGDWEHQWNYSNLGAAYEEVSQGVDEEGNPNGNIKIVTEEAKNITVIFDATAGKITLEGLTEKVVVISYVLMGVNDDWTTGIPLVRNEENTEFEEYMLLDQEILAGDSVKVVTLVDGVATAWCGRVDMQSVELLGITFAENGNIILAPGKYDFYYKVADDGIYIAGEVYPVEPEVISYELNGGELVVEVPTQEELWASFKTAAGLTTLGTLAEITEAGAGKPHNDQNNPCACRIICAKLLDANVNAVFALPEWAWLKAYIMTVQSGLPEASSAAWRYAFAAFFLQSEHSVWPASADFTEAGKPENWGAAYEAAHEVVLPTEPVAEDYTLPTPVKEGCTFKGWYDNAEGTGDAYSVIPAGWSGTLYAIWEVEGPATGVDNVNTTVAPIKVIENGQLIIINNGVRYNVQGAVIK